MADCKHCRFAEWDYEEYFNTTDKQWFVSGCIKDEDEENCEGFEECVTD